MLAIEAKLEAGKVLRYPHEPLPRHDLEWTPPAAKRLSYALPTPRFGTPEFSRGHSAERQMARMRGQGLWCFGALVQEQQEARR